MTRSGLLSVDDFTPDDEDHDTIARALLVCEKCPVIAECAGYAMDIGDLRLGDNSQMSGKKWKLTGVWGGVHIRNTRNSNARSALEAREEREAREGVSA